jgi:glycosyltransferase involved in cell wall biosynthesis
MKIAFFTPLNPVRSGISDYSEELLPYLAKYCQIDVFTDDRVRFIHEGIAGQFPCYGYARFESKKREQHYDATIFQIGNAACHIEPYDCLLKYGGLMVLHELNISGIVGAKTLARGDGIGFLRQMLVTEGPIAFMAVACRFLLTKRFPEPNAHYMNRLAIKKSKGIIVHNEYMRNVVSSVALSNQRNIPVWTVRQPVLLPETWTHSTDSTVAKAKLGLDKYAFVISSFGFMCRAKRISVALRAFSRLLRLFPNAIYLLVGEVSSDIEGKIGVLGLGDRVRSVGYVDLETFYLYIAASDFCVNLRYPSAGETSASLLRIMSMGKAVAVSNYAQFTEYPDDCCIKIDLGEKEEDLLFEQMCRMASDPALRARYGRAARKYIQQNHTPDRAAWGYYEALKEIAGEDCRLS